MKITVLSRSTCSPCNQLKKFLDYKNYSYESIDVDEHPELLQGYTSVPITIIEKDNVQSVVIGYNPSSLMSNLA